MPIQLDASEARAVRLTLKQPGLTRAELAELLGASRLTATSLVKRLVESGVLSQDGATPSTGGRPAAKLFVSDGIGYCCSHQVIQGRLTSCGVDPSGNIFGKVDRPVQDITGMLKGIGAAELELSVKSSERAMLASGIVVPGIVDRRTNTGEAPWLFGKETIDPAAAAPHTFLVSGAECLTSRQAAPTTVSKGGPWLTLDMANSLSGLFLTRGGEPVPLDLAHLEPNPAIISDEALDGAIRRAAESRSSVLGNELSVRPSAVEGLATALAENDQVACALADRLVAETLDVARSAARTLRPNWLILASNLIDPGLGLTDAILSGLVRHSGVPQEGIMLIRPQDVVEERFIGACRAALNLKLGEIERSGGTLKVE